MVIKSITENARQAVKIRLLCSGFAIFSYLPSLAL
jgi:hypothetical protein